MNQLNRRDFISLGGLSIPAFAFGKNNSFAGNKNPKNEKPRINFTYDATFFMPTEYAEVLSQIINETPMPQDEYGVGGYATAVEEQIKTISGKEAAIFLPTGTMANNVALHIISKELPVIFTHFKSHLYTHEADAATALFKKKMISLNKGAAYFSPEELFAAIEEHKKESLFGYDIGAVSVEIAPRFVFQRIQPIEQLRSISNYARKNNIGLHLDGARIHMASGYSGVSVKEYCSLFDTVYMDLYKYFRAGAGAVLCGSKEVIEKMPRYIKMCGGSMWTNWTNTAVANHFIPGFEERFQKAKANGYKIIDAINKIDGYKITAFEDGSNVYLLHIKSGDAARIAKNLVEQTNIYIRIDEYDEQLGAMPFKINETQLQVTPEEIAQAFEEALK